MARKVLGMFTAVATALLLVGVAWAETGGVVDEPSSAATSDSTVTTDSKLGDDTTSTSINGDTTSTSINGDTTSTSINGDTTSTSINGDTTSTSINGDTTSTTIDHDEDDQDDQDDQDDEDDEDENGDVLEDQLLTYTIPGVGSVTVEILDGRLGLVDVSAPGWVVDIEHEEDDRIEVEFRSDSDEVEFEAEIEHGNLSIEIEFS